MPWRFLLPIGIPALLLAGCASIKRDVHSAWYLTESSPGKPAIHLALLNRGETAFVVKDVRLNPDQVSHKKLMTTARPFDLVPGQLVVLPAALFDPPPDNCTIPVDVSLLLVEADKRPWYERMFAWLGGDRSLLVHTELVGRMPNALTNEWANCRPVEHKL